MGAEPKPQEASPSHETVAKAQQQKKRKPAAYPLHLPKSAASGGYQLLSPGIHPGHSQEFLMVFLPIIANNLGKVAVAAATTLGLVGYVNRERIGRWLADESDERNQERPQDPTRVLETADKKHAELLDKLALNTAAVTEFKGLIKDVHEELGSMAENFQGELDALRSETRALGEELREAVADLTRRQDAVEQYLHGKDRGEVFAVPGRQRTAAEIPRRQEETGKKPTPNGRRKGNNGSTAPETRAP